MPIVINLKDLTQSDGPGSIVDKVNFNFQQLLALGVGSVGPVGPQGTQGPVGPTGLTGEQGERGTRWYTYADILPSDPTLSPTDPEWVPPTDLELGDIYTDSLFNVWEYRINPTTQLNEWIKFIDSNNIFSSFLISTRVTFKRTFQPSDGNSAEERFITFNQTAGADKAASGSGNADYYNDTLFLHNFDQTQISNEFVGQNVLQFYNAMESIYVDHYNSSDDLNVRYHLQLGTVYKTTGGVRTISKANETLKIKYVIVTDSNSTPIMHLSLFNASKNDSDASSLGQYNSAFQFKFSKWDGTNHTTMWSAFTTAQNIQQFTDTTFTLIDGMVVARSTSKIAVGIENNGTRLALIGSTGTGAITGVYSNVPIDQFGDTSGVTKFNAPTLYMINTAGGVNRIQSDIKISLQSSTEIQLQSDRLYLSADVTGAGVQTTGAVLITNAGKVGAGRHTIPAVAGKVSATSVTAPTANLMANGSFAAALRKVISSSSSGEMVLADTDHTIYFDAFPVGSTSFDLTAASSSNANRIVILANNTANPLTIVSGAQTLGTLSAKNTAIYQSFGSAWLLLFAAPNTLPTSGSSTQLYVSMSITNIQNIPIQTATTHGNRQIADLTFSFWSDQHGTIAVPVKNVEIRVQHASTVLDTFVSPTPVTQPTIAMFATTSEGGSPQVLFPGVEMVYDYYYRSGIFNFNKFHYTRNNTYSLADAVTPGANTQSDGITTLQYLKVS